MYYKKALEQYNFFNFNQGFGFPIDTNNRWVKLAETIPWDDAEKLYSENFSDETGAPSISFRIALGALMIREILSLSDRATVKAIQENPYLQYFLGVPKFTTEPLFHPSLMVQFRKRISLEDLKEINEMTINFKKKLESKCDNETVNSSLPSTNSTTNTSEIYPEVPDQIINEDSLDHNFFEAARKTYNTSDLPKGLTSCKNYGILIIDATCCPVNIRFPQDYSLLYEAHTQLDGIITRICFDNNVSKPRTYPVVLRNAYLDIAKAKKKGVKKLRRFINKILNAVSRDLRYIDDLISQGCFPAGKELETISVIRQIYDQQKYMYDNNTHKVENKIVSIFMPFIRPIVRGKTDKPVEFGPKIDVSLDGEGYAHLEKLSYDAYNEGSYLKDAIAAYVERHGCFPEKVLADQIYQTKDNRLYCQQFNITMTGKPLGKKASAGWKPTQEFAQDAKDRIGIEREFSRDKHCFGLEKILEKTAETVKNTVALGIFLGNVIPYGF